MQRDIVAPGELDEVSIVDTSVCLYGFPGFQLLDSLAVDGDGNVCVATLVNGGITVISPAGELIDFVPTGDILTTNICFGGDDLTTAYITISATGKLLKMTWPRPGAKLQLPEHLSCLPSPNATSSYDLTRVNKASCLARDARTTLRTGRTGTATWDFRVVTTKGELRMSGWRGVVQRDRRTSTSPTSPFGGGSGHSTRSSTIAEREDRPE